LGTLRADDTLGASGALGTGVALGAGFTFEARETWETLYAIGAGGALRALRANWAGYTGGSLDQAAVYPCPSVLVPDPEVAGVFHYPGVTGVASGR
jgi:hypothetical protein